MASNAMRVVAAAAISAAMLAAGCASTPTVSEQTLSRIYSMERKTPKDHIGIFIPGIMGTALKDTATGRYVWGGAASRVLAGMLSLPLSTVSAATHQNSVVPAELLSTFRWFGGLAETEVYATAARVAVDAGGYTPGDIQDPGVDANTFAFKYDWRMDLVQAAIELGAAIERIQAQHPEPKRIRLLCHSAGGLVARYYLKYGAQDVLDQEVLPEPTYAGARYIEKIVMLGTPNTGALEAFERLHEGIKIPTIGWLSAETVFSMPSVYQ